jgi:hypothetical protein
VPPGHEAALPWPQPHRIQSRLRHGSAPNDRGHAAEIVRVGAGAGLHCAGLHDPHCRQSNRAWLPHLRRLGRVLCLAICILQERQHVHGMGQQRLQRGVQSLHDGQLLQLRRRLDCSRRRAGMGSATGHGLPRSAVHWVCGAMHHTRPGVERGSQGWGRLKARGMLPSPDT